MRSRAVNGVSFDIREGEIFSLLGPNGAGKTTTISVLSTLYAPTSGDAHDRRPFGHAGADGRPQVIGVVPQELALYDDLTARENLAFWGQMYNLGGTALKARIAEVLEQIGLADRANQRVKTYSGGMKRRVNIGVGLLHRPRLLFMDEPTVGIDPQSRRAILDSVKELNQQGMTVLYTTHYMEEAQELSDRVGIIDHGELIALGTQAELRRQVGENDAIVLHIGEGENGEALAALPSVASRACSRPRSADHASPSSPRRPRRSWRRSSRGNAHGVRIRSVEIQEPDLEAVFLHLTGRALRD